MARRRKSDLPSYRLHKQSGQAVVSLPLGNCKYRDVLLGPFDTEQSKQEYARVINEWLAAGRLVAASVNGRFPDLTISELCLFFWKYAETYYRRADGSQSGELYHFQLALDPLEQFYGPTPAINFGPLALKAIRQQMIGKGSLCRRVINQRIEHIKRMFRWAVSDEHVPSSIYEALRSVAGLRRGHPGTYDKPKVKPVSDRDVQATLPFLSPQVAAMVQLQRLLGGRSSEICAMQGRNIDQSGQVWWYKIDPNEVGQDGKPTDLHKTASHENPDGTATIKILPIGPMAQAILRPWLRENPDEYLFQPREARKSLDKKRRANRKTPMTPSQLARKPKANPKRRPKDRYDQRSYGHAIKRACEKAKVAHWHPHQLKHSCGTEIRRKYGAEASQVYLGHSKLSTTEIYAEADLQAIEKIALEMG